MHAMKSYACNMSKFTLSIGSIGIALAVGLIVSVWLAIQILVFLTSIQM